MSASGAEIVLLKAMPPVTPADELVDQVEAMLQNPWQEQTGAMGSMNSHLDVLCYVGTTYKALRSIEQSAECLLCAALSAMARACDSPISDVI